jgi:hypothetical protein
MAKMIIDFGDGDISEMEIPEFSADEPVPNDLRQSGEWLAEVTRDAAEYLNLADQLQQAGGEENEQSGPLLEQLRSKFLAFQDVPFDGHIQEFSTWIKQPGVSSRLPVGTT